MLSKNDGSQERLSPTISGIPIWGILSKPEVDDNDSNVLDFSEVGRGGGNVDGDLG